MGLRILYEDNHLIAVNKRSSDIVQGDKTGDEPLSEKIKVYLKNTYQKQGNVFCGVIHRLDRPVSGAVLFAKTSKALARMNALLKNREIHKFYWGIVKDKPEETEATLIHYLKKNEKSNKAIVSHLPKKDYLQAELAYKLLASSDKYHLLEIELKTGRHHQIRAQLSAINAPLKGDIKYGFPRTNSDASISLHARRVSFIHPVSGKEVTIVAPVPDDNLWQYFEKMILNTDVK
ncbi:MAG: RluA family pseudouridine synthase [Bacteroidales bacterium]|jgi:23S rRNA pseudouridine1911/1915/1917 synthase|nr:RluA family pseudouridine synthase [Bacteroidales bacterium]